MVSAIISLTGLDPEKEINQSDPMITEKDINRSYILFDAAIPLRPHEVGLRAAHCHCQTDCQQRTAPERSPETLA